MKMICVSIQNRNLEEIFSVLEEGGVEMAEIRLDRCPLSLDDIETLFSFTDVPLIATCRVGEGAISAQDAESRLVMAIRAGAAYVDVEIEAPAMMSKRVRREAHEYGTRLIRSYHDFSGTESTIALESIGQKCLHLGAEVVKIVTTAHSEADVQKVMALYDAFPKGSLVAFCMGEEGSGSRLECLRRGSPFTYASTAQGEQTASGQWPLESMRKALYGDFRLLDCQGEAPLRMPCSKSFAQRAIIAAALSDGTSHLRGYSPCGDNVSAINAAREIGADVVVEDDSLTITGIGTPTGPVPFTKDTLHVGESGFLTRMLIPVLSEISTGPVHLTGEKTLLRRPLSGARDIMKAFGVTLSCEGEEESEEAEVKVPLTISGKLTPGDAEISGKSGSQLVSGLLSALPLCDGDTVLTLTSPKSIPYLFITLDVLKNFSVRMANEMEGGEQFAQNQDWGLCDKMTFTIKGGQRYHPCDMVLEADWSSAAPFLVAGAIFGSVEVAGMDTKSLQADLSIMDILTEAGVSISEYEDGGVLHVQRAPLRGFEVDGSNCPDLFPIVAVLAAFCEGRSRISGVSRLATKESDRAGAILGMLSQMGVRSFIKGDALIVDGQSLSRRLLSGNLLRGGHFTTHHDHRMVMAILVASLGCREEVTLDDTQCVDKSFPLFLETFSRMKEGLAIRK